MGSRQVRFGVLRVESNGPRDQRPRTAQCLVEATVAVLRGFVFRNEECRQGLTDVGVGVGGIQLDRALEMADGVAYLGAGSKVFDDKWLGEALKTMTSDRWTPLPGGVGP